MASSRHHSDLSSGEDERNTSQPPRPKRPLQRRGQSTAGPSSTRKYTSRLAASAVDGATRRGSQRSMGDSDIDSDDIYDDSTGNASVWHQLTDGRSVMTPPGAVVELPAGPSMSLSAGGNILGGAAADIDWANFVHAYARGRWNPSVPLQPPGRSTAFPGSNAHIVLAPADASSDSGLTFSDAGSEGRRLSISYDKDGVELLSGTRPSAFETAADTSASEQSSSTDATQKEVGSSSGQPSIEQTQGILRRSKSSSHGRPRSGEPAQGQGQGSNVAKVARDLRVLQFSTASSPQLSRGAPIDAVGSHQPGESSQAGLIVDKMQRASKSLSQADASTIVKGSRDAAPTGRDDTVWHQPDPFSAGAASIRSREDHVKSTHTETAPASETLNGVSTSTALAIGEAQKRAAGEGPHRPGPTPVQPGDHIDIPSLEAMRNSAPAGVADHDTEGQRRQPLGRSESDPASAARSQISSSVDALRQAARRSAIKRSEDEIINGSQPTTIHSGHRSRSDHSRQLLDVTTPPGQTGRESISSSTSIQEPPSLSLERSRSGQTLTQPTQRSHEAKEDGNATPHGSTDSETHSKLGLLEAPDEIPTRTRTSSDLRPNDLLSRRYSQSPAPNNYFMNGKRAEEFYMSCGYLPAITPPNERERREALRRYGPPKINGDVNFDRLGHLVRLVFNCEIVLISLVGTTQQVFQTAVGGGGDMSAEVLQHIAGAKDCSFCAHAILQNSEEPLVIADTHKDWRFAGNPLVVGAPHIRFYAGTPLRTHDGLNLGSLCIIDTQPRTDFTPRQRHTLKEFGRVVMRELELTRDQIHLRTRDRMQRSIELFTRDCLEMEVGAQDGKDGKPKSGMGNLYNSSAKAMHETLQAAGAVVFDLSHFELIESPGGLNGGSSKIFFPSPFSAPDVTPYANFDDPSVIETITSNPGRTPQSIKTSDVPPMAVLGSSEASQPLLDRAKPVPLNHHIKIAEFLRKHRTGHFYPAVPSVFRSLLPSDAAGLLLVPIFGINKQPFALLCAYSKQRQDGPVLEDMKDTALQYMRSMGTIILSAVLKKDIMLADQAKSHFISNISHELRTPLHGILASAELLAETKLNATQGSYLETVEACGKSLLELVNHVLDFTKLSGSARTKSAPAHSLTPTDLVRLVQEVCESSWIGQMARKLESQQSAGIGSAYAIGSGDSSKGNTASQVKQMKSGDVETVIDISMREDGWLVNCDAGGIRRVMMNLIGNALKFTSSGFVHISMREVQSTPEHVVVELGVTDTGRGIGKPFLEEQLFHPFTQENQLGPGTGLGLSIVNSIVQSSSINGKIDVWSTVGEGTEMRITCEMPLVESEDIDGPVYRPSLDLKQARAVSLVGFQGNRGQLDLRQVLRNYFEGWWRFAPCKEGDDAYDGDIVLINEDIGLIEKIREHRKPLPPVIVLTSARGDTGIAQVCRAYHDAGGIARILFKPAGPAKLEAVVDFCLQCLERRENGEPPSIEETSPSTPLPSPMLSPAVTRLEDNDNYFAPRAHRTSSEEQSRELDAGDGSAESEIADHTPMGLDGQTPTAQLSTIQLPSAPARGEPTRPPLAPLRGDSHHVSPKPLSASNAAMLIRRHSAEEAAPVRAPQALASASSSLADSEASDETPSSEAARNHPVAKTATKPRRLARPLLPPRSITFHAEPRLNKQVALSPSACGSTDRHNVDYFSSQKVETRDGNSERNGASPGSLVPIEGSANAHVLRSAIGTVPDPKPSGKRIRVLGVDDNEINIKVLSAFVGKLGAEFMAASGGEQALSLFDSAGPFDVIIVDLTMPGLDGFQVTSEIRRKESARHKGVSNTSKISPRVKVLCLTGRTSDEDKRKAFAAGADGFITRPLSLRALSTILKLLTSK